MAKKFILQGTLIYYFSDLVGIVLLLRLQKLRLKSPF